MFVQPASHDAGLALGACWAVAATEGRATETAPLRHVYLGTDVGAEMDIENKLAKWSPFIKTETIDNSAARTATLLSAGAVVGYVGGRAEFGPRALGNRSILADPRPASNKQLINSMVKKRESFRPFAPSVVSEKVDEYFEIPSCQADLSYMTYTLKVREKWRSVLGAITHVDGTARIQTVSRAENPTYWQLLNEFGKITGLPILLNTSFNNNAEPIVDSLSDAIECFLTTGLHYLVFGKYLISKRYATLPHELCTQLAVTIPSSMRLVRQSLRDHSYGTLIESSKGNFIGRRTVEILPSTFAVLSICEDDVSIGELLKAAGIGDAECSIRTTGQLVELWSKRMIRLHPSQKMRVQC